VAIPKLFAKKLLLRMWINFFRHYVAGIARVGNRCCHFFRAAGVRENANSVLVLGNIETLRRICHYYRILRSCSTQCQLPQKRHGTMLRFVEPVIFLIKCLVMETCHEKMCSLMERGIYPAFHFHRILSMDVGAE
jgi:hypothetical protein